MTDEQPWYVSNFSAGYLERYAHRNDDEATHAVAALATHLGFDTVAPADRDARPVIVDLACGAGRHVSPLLAAGAARVVGVDLSKDLLAAAAESLRPDVDAGRVELRLGDMRAVPLPDGCADAVVSFFTSFGYFEDEADDRRVLAEVHRLLRPHGRYLLDFLNAPAVIAALVAESVTEALDGGSIVSRRHLDLATRRLEKTTAWTHPDGRVDSLRESVRAYTPDELRALLIDADFAIIEQLGDYRARPYTPESPRCIFVAERSS